jgi:hypothetical protein
MLGEEYIVKTFLIFNVPNLLSSRSLSNTMKIRIHKIIILPGSYG